MTSRRTDRSKDHKKLENETVSKHRIGWKPIPQFAKEHAHRDPRTVWWWIRTEKLPKYLVKNVQGHLEIDVDAWFQFVEGQSVNL